MREQGGGRARRARPLQRARWGLVPTVLSRSPLRPASSRTAALAGAPVHRDGKLVKRHDRIFPDPDRTGGWTGRDNSSWPRSPLPRIGAGRRGSDFSHGRGALRLCPPHVGGLDFCPCRGLYSFHLHPPEGVLMRRHLSGMGDGPRGRGDRTLRTRALRGSARGPLRVPRQELADGDGRPGFRLPPRSAARRCKEAVMERREARAPTGAPRRKA